MGIKLYYENTKRDVNKALEEYLNKHTLDKSFEDINEEELSELVYTREQAEEIILKKSDRKAFLSELKRNIKPQVIDNMAKRLDGRTGEEIEMERKEQIKKYTKSMENSEKIEEDLVENEPEEEGKKKDKSKDINAIRSEVLKAVYEEALREYYDLVSDLQVGFNGEVSRGSSDNGYKMNTKLIMYQNYLRRLDMWYGSVNNGAHIAYDERIANYINMQENKKITNDLIVNEKRQAKIDAIDELNNKLDSIAKKMSEISSIDDDLGKNTEELRRLMKEYSELKYALANIKPSIGILYAEDKEAEKNEDFKRRLGILTYKKRTDKKIFDSKNKSKSKRELTQDKNSNERVNEIVSVSINNNLQKAEKALNDFDRAIDDGRLQDAIQSLKVANELCYATSNITESIDVTGDRLEEIKARVSEKDDQSRKKELNRKMGIGAVYSEDEVLLNDLKAIRDNIKSGIDRNKVVAERNDVNEKIR